MAGGEQHGGSMAREIRIEYAGATDPVMDRGNQGREIYQDKIDRKLWLDTLAEACEKTGWRIHENGGSVEI